MPRQKPKSVVCAVSDHFWTQLSYRVTVDEDFNQKNACMWSYADM